MKAFAIAEPANTGPERPRRPGSLQVGARFSSAQVAAKRGILRRVQLDFDGTHRPGKARKGLHLSPSLALRLGREPMAPEPADPASPPCPTPGFNGAHYFVEVDPDSGAPRPFTNFLRCRWCGAGHRAMSPPSFRHRDARRLRPVTREEELRAVRDAL